MLSPLWEHFYDIITNRLHILTIAQSAGAVEYTDCIFTKG